MVAGNFAGPTKPNSDLEGNFSGQNNLIGDSGSAGGLTNGANGNLVGNNGSGTRPLATILKPTLANNGGPTLMHALVPGSPAINRGSNANIPSGVTTDQRGTGFARIALGTVDIGAVEFTSASDINRDDKVDIDDILVAIFIFAENRANLPIPVANLPPGPPFPDANQDNQFDIDDILQIIFDRVQFLANPEGEGESSSAVSASEAETANIAARDALFADATEEAAAAWFAPPTKVRKPRA